MFPPNQLLPKVGILTFQLVKELMGVIQHTHKHLTLQIKVSFPKPHPPSPTPIRLLLIHQLQEKLQMNASFDPFMV